MSSISSATHSNSLAAYYKKFQAADTSAASSTTATTSTDASPDHSTGMTDRIDSALEKQGITGTSLSDLREKIQTAVDSAKSDSSTSNDPDAVKTAVDSVLKDAGVNMDELRSDMKAGGRHGHGGPPPVAQDDSDSTTADTASTGSSSLDSLLSQYGIDTDSFKSSLMSLLNNGNSTGSDFSSLFSGAAKGSGLDVTA